MRCPIVLRSLTDRFDDLLTFVFVGDMIFDGVSVESAVLDIVPKLLSAIILQ